MLFISSSNLFVRSLKSVIMEANSKSVCSPVTRVAFAIAVVAIGLLRPNDSHAQSSTPREATWVTDGPVYAIACTNGTVYVGGSFTRVGPRSGGGVTRYSIAALDAATGAATAWNPSTNGTVSAIAVSGSTVYVGGNFTSMGGQPRNNIAALSAATGGATTWNPNANSGVRAFAISGSTVYVGGDFTRIGGKARNYIAALDAATGAATSWNPNADSSVRALAISDSTAYVGGFFTIISEQLRNRIAALSTATGAATDWNPNQNDPSGGVFALGVSGSTVYAGGAFLSVGEQPRFYIAAIDKATGAVTAWNPTVSGQWPNVSVDALAVSGGTICAGGRFTSVGGQTRNNIAALDTVTAKATAWNPNAGGYVRALALSSGALYIGGDFTTIGGVACPYFAQFDLPGLPAAPSNPAADSATTVSIRWRWRDNSTNEDWFRVWEDQGSAAPTTLRATMGAGATSWTQTGLLRNTQHTFQVASTNIRGTSAKTTPLTAWTLAAVPKRPVLSDPQRDALAVAIGAGDGNPLATEYAIYCVTTEQWLQENGTLGVTPVWATAAAWGTKTVTGLLSDTLYEFQARARNGARTETALGPSASLRTLPPPTRAKRWHLY